MNDLISRQAAIKYLMTNMNWYDEDGYESDDDYKRECITELINGVPSAQPEQRWIPFKTRPLTKEEKEEHPEWDGILDCKLPDDGQRILVNVSVRGHESVQYDEFYTDDGSYLDSGYEIGTEATAWMPLPEPYMGTRSDTSDRRKTTMYFGKPIPEWITEHRNDTITLGEISDACEKAQASCLRLAERVLKVGRDQDLAAYAWFMQEYLNEKKALDLALDILGERYGYPDGVPEEDTAHDDDLGGD